MRWAFGCYWLTGSFHSVACCSFLYCKPTDSTAQIVGVRWPRIFFCAWVFAFDAHIFFIVMKKVLCQMFAVCAGLRHWFRAIVLFFFRFALFAHVCLCYKKLSNPTLKRDFAKAYLLTHSAGNLIRFAFILRTTSFTCLSVKTSG